jgi:hypothetical protein
MLADNNEYSILPDEERAVISAKVTAHKPRKPSFGKAAQALIGSLALVVIGWVSYTVYQDRPINDLIGEHQAYVAHLDSSLQQQYALLEHEPLFEEYTSNQEVYDARLDSLDKCMRTAENNIFAYANHLQKHRDYIPGDAPGTDDYLNQQIDLWLKLAREYSELDAPGLERIIRSRIATIEQAKNSELSEIEYLRSQKGLF